MRGPIEQNKPLRYVSNVHTWLGTSNVMEASSPKENELIYSEAEDGKPKPIPVAEFARYFKGKSENGAIVLREEFKVRLSLSHNYFTTAISCYRDWGDVMLFSKITLGVFSDFYNPQ